MIDYIAALKALRRHEQAGQSMEQEKFNKLYDELFALADVVGLTPAMAKHKSEESVDGSLFEIGVKRSDAEEQGYVSYIKVRSNDVVVAESSGDEPTIALTNLKKDLMSFTRARMDRATMVLREE